jgi:hypothetical protein
MEDRGTPATARRPIPYPIKICIFVGLIAKRQAHGRNGLAASAMLFSAKKESAKLQLAAANVCRFPSRE